MWQITLRELKDRKWSLLGYSLGSLAMLWLYVATFRSSQNSTQQLQELVKTYPKGLLDALGLSNLTLDTVEKYLNAKHFSLLWPLLAIILALSRAGSQFAGEVQNGTMGLLLALPLERWQIFIAKYAAGLATIVIFAAVSVFGIIPLASAYHIPTHPHVLWGAWILTSLFMWAVYSAGLAVSSWVSEIGKVYAIMSTVLILSYVAHIVALIVANFEWLKHYSIFYYFDTQGVLATGHIMPRTLIVFGG
ncbi:MAG TPA: ABC transporter permease subunit, partial [Candidatus Polarisedimenticolaceae bacterium]|nr:ABC transporter permease subunit [Candidatus Polarisedimenticolaceae bacterium]